MQFLRTGCIIIGADRIDGKKYVVDHVNSIRHIREAFRSVLLPAYNRPVIAEAERS
jgi:hypothetical protein